MHLPLDLAVAPLMLQRRPHGPDVSRYPISKGNELGYLTALCVDEPPAQPISISLFDNLDEA
jgi:hypothetical protein